jgi:hypothetical protein
MRIVAEATRRRRELESSIRRCDRRHNIREWALHRQDGIFGTDSSPVARQVLRTVLNSGAERVIWLSRPNELKSLLRTFVDQIRGKEMAPG